MPTPGSAQALTAKGCQTRAAIEQAACKLFAERGFHGTTLADITSAAGKSAAAIATLSTVWKTTLYGTVTSR